jgi:Uma2 family endonuclease
MVRCGSLPRGATSFDDPSVIAEVMSKGSVDRDLSEKGRVYRRLAALQHYVLVDRDEALVDVFDRSGDAWASRQTLEGVGAELVLPVLGVSIPLAEIYEGVLPA